MTSYLTMLVDYPFGTVCAFLIYLGFIFIFYKILGCFRVPCPYEFEVLDERT